jgi:hypothetical protein
MPTTAIEHAIVGWLVHRVAIQPSRASPPLDLGRCSRSATTEPAGLPGCAADSKRHHVDDRDPQRPQNPPDCRGARLTASAIMSTTATHQRS